MLRFVCMSALVLLVSLTSCTSCRKSDSQSETVTENVNTDAGGTKVVYGVAPTELFLNAVRREDVTSDEIVKILKESKFTLQTRIQGKKIEDWLKNRSSQFFEQVSSSL